MAALINHLFRKKQEITAPVQSVDIHSHLAWGIDDGIPDIEDARQALECAKADGIVMIASTPHYTTGKMKDDFWEVCVQRQQELKNLAAEYGISIVCGAEVMMNSHFIELLKSGNLPVYENTNCVLLEYNVRFPWDLNSPYQEYPFEAKVRGYQPVLAHPERYFHKGLDMDVIEAWKDQGILFQLNASSLTGENGPIIQKNARKLVKMGLVDFVATDTHCAAGTRMAVLSKAWNEVCRLTDEKTANKLFFENPKAMLFEQYII